MASLLWRNHQNPAVAVPQGPRTGTAAKEGGLVHHKGLALVDLGYEAVGNGMFDDFDIF